MQQRIKEILGLFLKLPADEINTSTIIDRSIIKSSIVLHRMYAKLAAENFLVDNYQDVHTYGDLLKNLNGEATNSVHGNLQRQVNEEPNFILSSDDTEMTGVGIDIEMIKEMPITEDFREDIFYSMNFSVNEIAHCILQPNPYASFAGLFAAKEAIVKADNAFKKVTFNSIVIDHFPNGRPFYNGFNLSISHTEEVAIAVAIHSQQNTSSTNQVLTAERAITRLPAWVWLVIVFSFFLSAISVYLTIRKT